MNEKVIMIGNVLGAIFQPLYFCLVIIKIKEIKNKKFLLILISILDYFLIQQQIKFTNGIYADLLYLATFYTILKTLYGSRIRITDVITYVIANVIYGILNVLAYIIFGMNIVGLIFALLIPIIIVMLSSKKITYIERFYNKFWNRSKSKRQIKSITIRGFSACITIILFTLLHFWIIYLLFR